MNKNNNHHNDCILKIGEIAKEADVNISTIRYYTDIGLLKAIDKTPGGQRLYEKSDTMNKLRLVKKVGRKGLSLNEIIQVMEFQQKGNLNALQIWNE